eukprot:10052578-Alexandrium_andersonii.AAC.1
MFVLEASNVAEWPPREPAWWRLTVEDRANKHAYSHACAGAKLWCDDFTHSSQTLAVTANWRKHDIHW